MSRVFVVGSINVDLVCRAERQPKPGETLFGRDFATHPGGKGANQAVAAARLGAETHMVGRVGEDSFGADQRRYLEEQGVGVRHVRTSEGVSTGVAAIVVSDDGQNSIVVVPGANEGVVGSDLPAEFAAGDVVVCPFEIPLETVASAFERAKASGARTVLNPAPARRVDRATLDRADVLIVNETELAFFASGPEPPPDDGAAVRARIDEVRTRPDQLVVATLGASGLIARGPEGDAELAGHAVRAVDTTAAGDTFVGAFVARMVAGDAMVPALKFANCAASICVERPGAGPSIPTRAEVDTRMAESGPR